MVVIFKSLCENKGNNISIKQKIVYGAEENKNITDVRNIFIMDFVCKHFYPVFLIMSLNTYINNSKNFGLMKIIGFLFLKCTKLNKCSML